MDSGLRRNEVGGRYPAWLHSPITVPAFAGMTESLFGGGGGVGYLAGEIYDFF